MGSVTNLDVSDLLQMGLRIHSWSTVMKYIALSVAGNLHT